MGVSLILRQSNYSFSDSKDDCRTIPERALIILTLGGAIFAKRHFELAYRDPSHRFGHHVLGHLESMPILGIAVAAIEMVVVRLFFPLPPIIPLPPSQNPVANSATQPQVTPNCATPPQVIPNPVPKVKTLPTSTRTYEPVREFLALMRERLIGDSDKLQDALAQISPETRRAAYDSHKADGELLKSALAKIPPAKQREYYNVINEIIEPKLEVKFSSGWRFAKLVEAIDNIAKKINKNVSLETAVNDIPVFYFTNLNWLVHYSIFGEDLLTVSINGGEELFDKEKITFQDLKVKYPAMDQIWDQFYFTEEVGWRGGFCLGNSYYFISEYFKSNGDLNIANQFENIIENPVIIQVICKYSWAFPASGLSISRIRVPAVLGFIIVQYIQKIVGEDCSDLEDGVYLIASHVQTEAEGHAMVLIKKSENEMYLFDPNCGLIRTVTIWETMKKLWKDRTLTNTTFAKMQSIAERLHTHSNLQIGCV